MGRVGASTDGIQIGSVPTYPSLPFNISYYSWPLAVIVIVLGVAKGLNVPLSCIPGIIRPSAIFWAVSIAGSLHHALIVYSSEHKSE